jgi:hypothetical protein
MASIPGLRCGSFSMTVPVRVAGGTGEGIVRIDFPYRITGPEGLPESFAVAEPLETELIFVTAWRFDEPQGRLWGRSRPSEPAQTVALQGDSLYALRVTEVEEGISRPKIGFDALLDVETGNALEDLGTTRGRHAGLDDRRIAGTARGEERDPRQRYLARIVGRKLQG